MILRNDFRSFQTLAVHCSDFLCYVYNPASLNSPTEKYIYTEEIFPKILERCKRAKTENLDILESILKKNIPPQYPHKRLDKASFKAWCNQRGVKLRLFNCVKTFRHYIQANSQSGEKQTVELPVENFLAPAFTRAYFLMNYYGNRDWLRSTLLPPLDDKRPDNLPFFREPRPLNPIEERRRSALFKSLCNNIAGFPAEDLNRHKSNFTVHNNAPLLPLLERFERTVAIHPPELYNAPLRIAPLRLTSGGKEGIGKVVEEE